MQSLIPASSGARAEELMTGGAGDDDSQEAKEKDRDAAVKSNSSKAATVESANRYIRVLKDSDAAQKSEIAELRKELERMRGKVGGEEVQVKQQDSPPSAVEGAKEDLDERANVAAKESPETDTTHDDTVK